MSILSSAVSVVGSLFGGSSMNNAMITIEDEGSIPCQFNPEELNITAEGHFSTHERQGEDSPIVQYLGGKCAVLDLKLYFDTSASYEMSATSLLGPTSTKASDVSGPVTMLLNTVRIEGKVHRPPEITFQWGSIRVTGFAKNVKVRYTMFETGGMPVRAEVILTILSLDLDIETSKLSPKESPDRTKCIVLTSDSSLWNIARQEYGDAGYWREIARANGIMDPLHVPAGTSLKVPALQN